MNPLADAVLAELRACTTADEIEAVATKYRADVMEMQTTDPARFHQIVNAKVWYLKAMEE